MQIDVGFYSKLKRTDCIFGNCAMANFSRRTFQTTK